MTIDECTVDGPTGNLIGSVTVSNDSPDTSDYEITVAFESADGTTVFGDGHAFVEGLAPGETTTEAVPPFVGGPSDVVCELRRVERNPSP